MSDEVDYLAVAAGNCEEAQDEACLGKVEITYRDLPNAVAHIALAIERLVAAQVALTAAYMHNKAHAHQWVPWDERQVDVCDVVNCTERARPWMGSATIARPGDDPPQYIVDHQAGDHSGCPPAECEVARDRAFI